MKKGCEVNCEHFNTHTHKVIIVKSIGDVARNTGEITRIYKDKDLDPDPDFNAKTLKEWKYSERAIQVI